MIICLEMNLIVHSPAEPYPPLHRDCKGMVIKARAFTLLTSESIKIRISCERSARSYSKKRTPICLSFMAKDTRNPYIA